MNDKISPKWTEILHWSHPVLLVGAATTFFFSMLAAYINVQTRQIIRSGQWFDGYVYEDAYEEPASALADLVQLNTGDTISLAFCGLFALLFVVCAVGALVTTGLLILRSAQDRAEEKSAAKAESESPQGVADRKMEGNVS